MNVKAIRYIQKINWARATKQFDFMKGEKR